MTLIYTLGNLNSKGDEYHYILLCSSFRKERELYIKDTSRICHLT